MEVIAGIGVPGCGKSTFLKPLAEKLGYEYINPDEIREELTGDAANHSHEEEVWQTVHSRIGEALKQKSVIVDATFAKVKDRRKLIEVSRNHRAEKIIGCWFKLPLSVCLERNSQRERVVPKEVILKMHNRLKVNPPSLDEGFDEIAVVEE